MAFMAHSSSTTVSLSNSSAGLWRTSIIAKFSQIYLFGRQSYCFIFFVYEPIARIFYSIYLLKLTLYLRSLNYEKPLKFKRNKIIFFANQNKSKTLLQCESNDLLLWLRQLQTTENGTDYIDSNFLI